jgi:altronate hydrolase
MIAKVLKVHGADNVIVALTDLEQGSQISYEGQSYTLVNKIPAKHKFTTTDLQIGDSVFMYGVLVGKASQEIPAGGLIHTGNLKHASSDYFGKTKEYHWKAPDVSHFENKQFLGYHRNDGTVGTANYWIFIPTVFCENRNLDFIKEALNKELGYAPSEKYKQFANQLVDLYKNGALSEASLPAIEETEISTKRVFPHVDGITFLNHQGGCGGTRQDSEVLKRLLASYVDHPNVAGATVLSLGCQHLQLDDFMAELKRRNPAFDKPVFTFEQQTSQSEEQLIKEAISKTFFGLIEANKNERKPAPLSKLRLGVKCGGSDGFSGISANPAVGHAADLLVALGGSVLLAEFPELNGVEQELADRCETPELAAKFVHLMKSYSAQAQAVGSGFDMNPSPGNIKDGLITDAIKSAGAAKKGGTAPITDVLDYTEPVTKPGLNLVCTPGNDVEATTGKASAGATLILFTTGLGTPTGNPICPVIKVSTNNTLAQKMSDIIDIDTGDVISKGVSISEMGEKILDFCIKVASGEIIPKAVQLQQDDFIPWKRGVSL